MAISGFIFDVDGCLALGPRAIPGAPQALRQLRGEGYRMVFCSNECSQTREAMAARLEAMGIQAAPREVVTAAEVAADYLGTHQQSAKVYAIGSQVLLQTLRDRGVQLVEGDGSSGADAVLVGNDREFTYDKLEAACRLIWTGAKLLAINLDRCLPTQDGLVPSTGALVTAVAYATDQEPVVLGKPSTWAARTALSSLGLEAAQVLVVGDQLDADIRMGRAAGCRTVLVLTGGLTQEDADRALDDRRPGLVLPGVGALPGWLHEQTIAGWTRPGTGRL